MNKPNSNNTTSNKRTPAPLDIRDFSIDKAVVLNNGHVTFDMTLNGIKIYGCFVVESKNGDFISLPQRQGSDGKYYSIVWARFTDDDSKAILQEVENKLNS